MLQLTSCVNNRFNISINDPIIIGQADTILAGGDSVVITLEMVSGEYFTANNTISTYRTNFKGEFQFCVRNGLDDAILFKERVVFEEDDICFDKMFDIVVDDYNNDGNPDFTIGQYGGSTNNIFKLYNVLPSGKIKEMLVGNTNIMTIANRCFSVKLDKMDKTTFYARHYNNEIAEFVDIVYTWDSKKFKVS